MKIKLIESGWISFTGMLGVVEFADGVSVQDVSHAEASRLASIVQVETLDGVNPSPAQQILDAWTGDMGNATTDTADKTPAVPAAVGKSWTSAELEELADKSGIKGLREVAEPLGLRGNSIVELIAKVVAATATSEAPAAAPEAAVDAATAAADVTE